MSCIDSLLRSRLLLALCLGMGLGCSGNAMLTAGDAQKVPVTFSGGHDISQQDFGRPITLIAAALEVKPEVFRKAFSGVRPAKGRGPSGDEARKNKAALMKVLAPHGVTNDRLDEVSNYYRFQPQRGELWKHQPAEAHALVENGKVKEIVITKGGHGYSSIPTVAVEGIPGVKFAVTLGHGKDFKKNGTVTGVKVVGK